MQSKKRKYEGFVLAELIMSMAVLGFLLVVIAISLGGYKRFADYQLTKQRCTSAAQAELESIAATGKKIDQEEFSRLWPAMQVTVEESVGKGQWENLKLVKVTTSVKNSNRGVKVQLAIYLAEER